MTTGTTQSFSEGKQLSTDLRASEPEQMAALVQELERISKTAKDYVVAAPQVELTGDLQRAHDWDADGTVCRRCGTSVDGGELPDANCETDSPMGPHLQLPVAMSAKAQFRVNRVAHEQIAEKMQIPQVYYRRMQSEAPELLATNVNHWLGQSKSNLLLRTLDSDVRAVLSDRFRALDNYDLFFHVGQVARDAGAVVQRLDLSDERFYMRLLQPGFAAKITGRGEDLATKGKMFSTGYRNDNGTWQGPDDDDPGGDWVFGGVVTSNSDVGRGGLNVESAVFRATCRNLIVVAKTLHRVYIGERLEGGFQVQNDTRQAKDRAVWLEVRDLVKATFDPEQFRVMVNRLNEAQATVLEEPAQAVDVVVEHYGLPEEDKQAILNELLSGTTGPTVWGLLNAVTIQAHGRQSVEAGIEVERIGGDMLTKVPELVKVRRV